MEFAVLAAEFGRKITPTQTQDPFTYHTLFAFLHHFSLVPNADVFPRPRRRRLPAPTLCGASQ